MQTQKNTYSTSISLRACAAGCLAALLFLTGCAADLSNSSYDAYESGVAASADPGVVIAKRAVTIDARAGQGQIGTAAGAIAGGVLGSNVGGSDTAHVAGAVGGALLGGILGNAADKAINKQNGFEYIVRITETNKTVAVVQAVGKKGGQEFFIGQKVMVVRTDRDKTRVRLIVDETAK